MNEALQKEVYKDFCKRIIQLREDLGLTQAQAAKEMGISPNALSNYERNIRTPNREAMKKFIDFYQVSYDYLLGREERSEDDMSPNTRILLQTLKGATEDEIAQAIKIVEALKK